MKNSIEIAVIERRRIIICAIFAIFYSLCQIAGVRYYLDLNGTEIWSASERGHLILIFIINLVASLIVSYILFYLALRFEAHIAKTNINTNNFSFRKYLIITLLFLICWSPYLIVFFPGTNQLDTIRQVAMALHLPTRATGRLITDGISIFYSAHHPVLISWIYGLFYKLGSFLGNVETGLFIYIILQDILFAITFSAALRKLEKYNVSKAIRVIVFLIYAFSPLITFSSFAMISDGLFAIAVTAFCIILFEIIQTKGKYLKQKKHIVYLILLMLAVCFCKKTGVYLLIITGIILLIIYRKYYMQILLSFLCTIVIFSVGFEGFFYNAYNIKTGGIQEALSIPFQQTARYFRDYPGEISNEEIEAVERVLDSENIAERYYAPVSDKVKNSFKENVSGEDLKNYFKAWFRGLEKSPRIYIDAFFYQTSRYFYTGYDPTNYIYTDTKTLRDYYAQYGKAISKDMDFDVNEISGILEEYDVKIPSDRVQIRNFIRNSYDAVLKIPIIGGVLTVGFCFQMAIFAGLYIIYRKKYNKLIMMLVVFLIIISCLISPINGSYRYSIPVFFMLPFLLGAIFEKMSSTEKNHL